MRPMSGMSDGGIVESTRYAVHRFAGMYIPPFDLVETRPLNDAMEGRALAG
jgi:hypothetical protein